MKLYDISLSFSPDLPVYPDDPPVSLTPLSSIARGDRYNVTSLTMTTHSGTHLDAARHCGDGGETVDQVPLSLLIGPVRVVEAFQTRDIGAGILSRLPVRGHERVLLKTGNSLLWGKPGFQGDLAHLTPDGAEYLVTCGVKLIGIDSLSVELFTGDGAVHRRLLGGGVVILEGLNLSGIAPGDYELICLPLKIADGDGAPCRAVLRRHEGKTGGEPVDPHSSKWPLA